MKVIKVTGKDINDWGWADNLINVINLQKNGKEFTLEQLINKIKTGKVAVVSFSSTIKKKEDIEPLLNNGFEVFAISTKDFNILRNYQML